MAGPNVRNDDIWRRTDHSDGPPQERTKRHWHQHQRSVPCTIARQLQSHWNHDGHRTGVADKSRDKGRQARQHDHL